MLCCVVLHCAALCYAVLVSRVLGWWSTQLSKNTISNNNNDNDNYIDNDKDNGDGNGNDSDTSSNNPILLLNAF